MGIIGTPPGCRDVRDCRQPQVEVRECAFVAVLLSMAAVTALLAWRYDADSRHLGAMAEGTARERVALELRARARRTASHAADSIAGALREQDSAAVARRLQPFMDDQTVAAISVTDRAGATVFNWSRPSQSSAAGVLRAEARIPVREMVEHIPVRRRPDIRRDAVLLEQATPAPQVSLAGRLGARAPGSRAWRCCLQQLWPCCGACRRRACVARGHELESPIVALIKGAERIGQGDYTRPVEVLRQDVLGELQQALERMRGACGNPRSTRTTCTACSTA